MCWDWEIATWQNISCGLDADRFAVGDWLEVDGVPVLATAQSSFVCRTAHRHEFGTHTIFIGELLAAKHRDDATPLTYFDRHYIDISEAPQGSRRKRLVACEDSVAHTEAGAPASLGRGASDR